MGRAKMIPKDCNFGRVLFFMAIIHCFETESTYAGNVNNTHAGFVFLHEVAGDLLPDVLQKPDKLLPSAEV